MALLSGEIWFHYTANMPIWVESDFGGGGISPEKSGKSS